MSEEGIEQIFFKLYSTFPSNPMANSIRTGQKDSKNLLDEDERDQFSGRIVFKCDNILELASDVWKFSEQKLYIRGLTWRILVVKKWKENSLGIYVNCQREGKGWSCRAIVSICLHSQNGGQNLVKTFECNFHPGLESLGGDFIEFWNSANGWLGEQGAILVSAEIKADEPLGVSHIPRSDVLLVNGKEVEVNKFHLAANSGFFKDFFFGEDCKKDATLVLEPPATVEDFKRMLDTMEPDNKPLDDHCIEAVLHLANQFQLDEVEGKCFNFLANESKRSAISKYRLLNEYSSSQLKKNFLNSSKKADFFKEADFVENLEEFAKLDEEAREALAIHLGAIRKKKPGLLGGICKAIVKAATRSSSIGPDVLLVDGVQVGVNKYHLAANSHFFEHFFFGQGYKANNQLELELPATVEHFTRMLDTMGPQKRPLDDKCIEGVLKLANQFLLAEVEGKCRNFLSYESERSAIFKYRLADKYGGSEQLKEFLNTSKKEDFFSAYNFVESLEEFAKLGGKAREALATRLRQLFASP